jgi:YD repeat-containing protein
MKEILITSSILIPVILILRWLFRGKVSHRLIYGAWILVALRLLVPMELGQWQYSFTALTQQSQPAQQIQQVLGAPVAGPSREEVYDQLLEDYIEENPQPTVPNAIVTVPDHVKQSLQSEADRQITAPSFGQIVTGLWIAGMCGMAIWFCAANWLFLRKAKKGATAAEFDGIPVLISSNIPSPCVAGLLRPMIYLTPACAADPQIRAHVLTHEKAHLRHGDHIWALVRCVCLCVYWFDPLVWIAAIQSRRDCELACDESALKRLGDDQRIAYGKSLLNTVAQTSSPGHLIHTATAMSESKKQLKERVTFIANKPRNILVAAICLVLVAGLTAGCAFIGSAPAMSGAAITAPLSNGYVTKPGYKVVYLPTELSNYDASGNLSQRHTYTYGETGQLICHNSIDNVNPENTWTCTMFYHSNGFLSRINYTYPGQTVKTILYDNYLYNQDGTLQSYEIITGDNIARHKLEYDSSGRLIHYTNSDDFGTKYNQLIYTSNGQLHKIVTSDHKRSTLEECAFSYDEQGRLAHFSSKYTDTTYRYNEAGQLYMEDNLRRTDLIYVLENGLLSGIYRKPDTVYETPRTYTFDGHGNVTSIVGSDGQRTEYRYVPVELPEQYADRLLRDHRQGGPESTIAAYYDDILSYYLPYSPSSVR